MEPTIFETRIAIGREYADLLVSLIDQAKFSISILMFDWRWYKEDFSNPMSMINHALIRAVRRGVVVQALTNYAPVVEQLKEVGILAKKWDSRKLLHAKIVIFDKKQVLMGSHNFTTKALTDNIEVSTLYESEDVVNRLEIYFESLWAQ